MQSAAAELKLQGDLYDVGSERLMRQRGIIEGDEEMTDALGRTVDSLLDLDTQLGGAEDPAFRARVIDHVNDGVFVFGTPILTNAGREQKVTAACTVLPIPTERGKVKMGDFFRTSERALQNAIGTGYDLSELDHPYKELLHLNGALDRINQSLVEQQQRPVASMATIRADHPEVLSFVRAKRDADFSEWRFNISLFVTEELFERAERGEPWELRDSAGEVVDVIDAGALIDEITDNAHYCGEPGILFKDRMERDNPTPQWEYESTAPCAEVAMAAGEACQFSYINLSSLATANPETGAVELDVETFGGVVQDMTRLLDASIEQTIQNDTVMSLPLVEQKRRIGVGITGFADMLIRMKIPYDDPRAIELAATVSELLDFHSKRASVDLAEERGAFPAYKVSRFLESEWTQRKIVRSNGAVSSEDWDALFADIDEHGIRHAATTSLPPTGTSSTIVKASKSLEPHFGLTDWQGSPYPSVADTLRMEERDRVAAELGKVLLAANAELPPELDAELPYLRTARQLSPRAHLEVQAAFQGFLDESLAKTVNLPQASTREEVREALVTAYRSGLKGVTVFRDNCLSERNLKVA